MGVTDQDTKTFIDAIKGYSNYDFSEYSEKSLKRRIERILVENKVNLSGLILKLKKDKAFLEQTVKDITVNTTELFRDTEVWHDLRQTVISKLKDNDTIKIWHAGCSTGQEVYSLEILLNEMHLLNRCEIYASDLNEDVIDVAKKGEYKFRFNLSYLSNFDNVIKENQYNFTINKEVEYESYFTIDKKNDKIKIHDFLTEKPIYKKLDLVKRENLFNTKFDLIMCRNVLIYFNLNLQNKIIDFFHSQLNNEGFLVLGKHESLLGYPENKFSKKGKFYQKKG
ncbi:MAG: hypothetical protein JXR60_11785 [Bacteroidales bacterium]|nr:hypothetical protein [Bacteroidales bacterium]